MSRNDYILRQGYRQVFWLIVRISSMISAQERLPGIISSDTMLLLHESQQRPCEGFTPNFQYLFPDILFMCRIILYSVDVNITNTILFINIFYVIIFYHDT